VCSDFSLSLAPARFHFRAVSLVTLSVLGCEVCVV
jgi:hypothetical protein